MGLKRILLIIAIIIGILGWSVLNVVSNTDVYSNMSLTITQTELQTIISNITIAVMIACLTVILIISWTMGCYPRVK